MKKIMFNDLHHLTEAVLAKYKRQTRRIESRQRYQVGEVVAVAMSYWDNYFGTPEGERLFSHSGTAGMHNKMFVKADEMRHKIRITNAWRENLQDISNEDCLAEGIIYDEDRQEYFFFEDYEGEFVMETRRIYSSTLQGAYALLIDKISGKGTWESNPEVTAYEFELLT